MLKVYRRKVIGILLPFLALFFISCAHERNLRRYEVGEYYINSGVSKYFLSDLPKWANFSNVSSCRREGGVRFLNFNSISMSLDLKYDQILHLQGGFNESYRELKGKSGLRFLPLKEEEKLFFRWSEQVQADVKSFRSPKHNKIAVIWVDRAIHDVQDAKKIVRWIDGPVGIQYYPVFLSHCLNGKELQRFISSVIKLDLEYSLISYDYFSPYSEKMELSDNIGVNLKMIIGDDKEVLFVGPSEKKVKEFRGYDKMTKY